MSALLLIPLLLGCVADVVAVDYLTVVNVAPPHGAAGVAVDTTASVTFSLALDEATVEGAVWLEDEAGAVVETVINYDRGSNTVHLRPSAALAAESVYTLGLSEALTSEAGEALVTTLASQFTTTGSVAPENYAPVAVIADPGAGCVLGDTVLLDGSYSYDPEGNALSWTWLLEESPEDTREGVEPIAEGVVDLTPDVPGDWLIGLRVSDGERDSEVTYVLVSCALSDADE